ncbi:uncharacterized protein LOC126623901 isoform X1 [Malus sylvestris]|uniref:uncharacterized protein LOC126623901 isoform X1 n=1 Tax=Malus sylvestris TaxID=3752 RepID=UPI0021AD0597|nr:uncharacterized protein LOC126623901 isoform X1 [Malus sylvestris]
MLMAMTRGGVAKSKMFMLSSYYREAKHAQGDHRRHFSSKLRGAPENISSRMVESDSEDTDMMESETGSHSSSSWRCNWVPHPRTGIYVPKGHEKVMDDVPKGAASLNQTFWLRNVDGVLEKPDPDTPPEHYYHYMHM